MTRLVVEPAIEQIRVLCRSLDVRGIHISGGEPFIYIHDVRKVAAAGAELGLAVAVATNASWASSRLKAEEILLRTPGLTQLLLSADQYHSEFFPMARVVFAAEAGVELGMHVTINVCRPHGTNLQFPDSLDKLQSMGHSNLEIVASDLELGGRANELAEAHWRERENDYPVGACRQLKRPVILENNSILACCNTPVAQHVGGSPLLSRSANGALDLASALKGFRQDKILQAIETVGPAFLAARLKPETKLALKGNYVKDAICELCQDMMSRPDVVEELRAMVSDRDISDVIAAAAALLSPGNDRCVTR